MPFYVGDYLRDTGHLTTAEHGAYMLLIMQAWTREGALPLDEARLRTLARMSPQEWKRSRDTLLAFFTIEDGAYRQKRVDQELNRTEAMIEQRSAAGKASAEARKKRRESNGGGNESGNGNPTTVERDAPRNSRPSQSPSQSKKDSEAAPLTPKPSSQPPTPRDLVWAIGIPLLVEMSGKSAPQCRSLLGKMLRDVRDDCPKLLLILQQAQEARPVDPLAWLSAATQGSARRPGRDEQILRAAGLWDDRDGPVIDQDNPFETRGMLQ